MGIFSRKEQRSFFAGVSVGKKIGSKGVKVGNKKTLKSDNREKTNSKASKEYTFTAFNENADVFNVKTVGSSRLEALKFARQKLKRDPEIPCWGVEITNDRGSQDSFRNVTIRSDGTVYDNWKSRYRSSDDGIRAKYPDLSKPVKRK